MSTNQKEEPLSTTRRRTKSGNSNSTTFIPSTSSIMGIISSAPILHRLDLDFTVSGSDLKVKKTVIHKVNGVAR